MKFIGPFIKCDEPTKLTGRVFPTDEVKKAIERVQERIDQGLFYGHLGMSDSLDIRLDDVAHLVERIEFDDETNEAIAHIGILDTPNGRVTKALLEEGVEIELRMRGTGKIDSETKVITDFNLVSIDIAPKE